MVAPAERAITGVVVDNAEEVSEVKSLSGRIIELLFIPLICISAVKPDYYGQFSTNYLLP